MLLSAALVLMSGFVNFYAFTKTDVIEVSEANEESKERCYENAALAANIFVTYI